MLLVTCTWLPLHMRPPEFQRLYTPSAFREERILWHAIIQLNLLRSVHIILDALADVRAHELPVPPPLALAPALAFDLPPHVLDPAFAHTWPRPHGYGAPAVPPAAPSTRSRRTTLHSDSASDPDSDSASLPLHHPPSALLPAHLHALRARLVPLQHAEARLIAALVPPSEDAPYLPAQLCGGYGSPGRGVRARHARADSDAAGEVFVRPGAAWKRAVRPEGRGCGPGVSGGRELAEEAQALLVACRADLMALWRDNTARTVLKRRKIRLEESPGL